MTQEIINVGSTELSGDGEPIRDAFIKANQNFTELYVVTDELTQQAENNAASIDGLQEQINTLDLSDLTDTNGLLEKSYSWSDSQGRTFKTVEWTSGNEITIALTPFETTNAITLDNRASSPYIYFLWNQIFIDNVWGVATGEPGQNYSISLDNGSTWIPVVIGDYTQDTFFYFYIPENLQSTYQFTYEAGQPAIIKYNRGSDHVLWLNLAEAPAPLTSIFAVDLTVVFEAVIQGETFIKAKILRPNFRFANTAYSSGTEEAIMAQYTKVWSGAELLEDIIVFDSFANNLEEDLGGKPLSQIVEELIVIDIFKNENPADAGKVYASYRNSNTGSITFYWTAKLYTIT